MLFRSDEEADRDESEVVDEDVAGRVKPVDEDGDDDERHEEHRRGRAPSTEHAVAQIAADEHARDARPLIEEVRPARALLGESLDRGEVGRRPVDNTVANEVDEDVRDGEVPEELVFEDVLHEHFLCGHLVLGDDAVLLRIVVLVLLDGRQPTGLGCVAHEEECEDGERDGDHRGEEEDTVPRAEYRNTKRRQRRDETAAEVVRDIPPRPPRAALSLGEPRHHGLCIGRVAHPLKPSVHKAEGAHERDARHDARHDAERKRDERAQEESRRGEILRIRAVRDVPHDELADAVRDREHGEDDAEIRLGVAVVLNHVGHRKKAHILLLPYTIYTPPIRVP